MKQKAIILFSVLFFSLSLQAKSKNDSATIHLDTLKAHQVHVFWQMNSILCLNGIINTQIKISPKMTLSIRTGYKFDPNWLHDNGAIGPSFRRYATGYLLGIKILHSIDYVSGSFTQPYYGVGLDFDYFNFPYTGVDPAAAFPFNVLKEGEKIECAKGNYQTYSIYGIIGVNQFMKFLSVGIYFGLGLRFKSFHTDYHFMTYYPAFSDKPPSTNTPIPKNNFNSFSYSMAKDFSLATPFLVIGINFGK